MQTQTEKLTEAQKLAKKEAEEQQLLAKILEQRQKSVSRFLTKNGAKVIPTHHPLISPSPPPLLFYSHRTFLVLSSSFSCWKREGEMKVMLSARLKFA